MVWFDLTFRFAVCGFVHCSFVCAFGFGPLEFGQWTTAQLNENFFFLMVVLTLDSLGPCVTCCLVSWKLASTEARLASSYCF